MDRNFVFIFHSHCRFVKHFFSSLNDTNTNERRKEWIPLHLASVKRFYIFLSIKRRKKITSTTQRKRWRWRWKCCSSKEVFCSHRLWLERTRNKERLTLLKRAVVGLHACLSQPSFASRTFICRAPIWISWRSQCMYKKNEKKKKKNFRFKVQLFQLIWMWR